VLCLHHSLNYNTAFQRLVFESNGHVPNILPVFLNTTTLMVQACDQGRTVSFCQNSVSKKIQLREKGC